MFDGSQKEEFFEWLKSPDTTCLWSDRGIKVKSLGRSQGLVRDCFLSMPIHQPLQNNKKSESDASHIPGICCCKIREYISKAK